MQNHIHLGTELEGAENAPSLKLRAIKRTIVIPQEMVIRRGVTGKLFVNVRMSGESVLLLRNMEYVVKVSQDEYNALLGMWGQEIKLIPHDHPNDGEDHSAHVLEMVLRDIRHAKTLDGMLQTEYYNIFLEDNSV